MSEEGMLEKLIASCQTMQETQRMMLDNIERVSARVTAIEEASTPSATRTAGGLSIYTEIAKDGVAAYPGPGVESQPERDSEGGVGPAPDAEHGVPTPSAPDAGWECQNPDCNAAGPGPIDPCPFCGFSESQATGDVGVAPVKVIADALWAEKDEWIHHRDKRPIPRRAAVIAVDALRKAGLYITTRDSAGSTEPDWRHHANRLAVAINDTLQCNECQLAHETGMRDAVENFVRAQDAYEDALADAEAPVSNGADE